MDTSTRFTLAVLSPLLKALGEGEDPVTAVQEALTAWEQPEVEAPPIEEAVVETPPTIEEPKVQDPPEPKYPFQIIIPEGEVRHIRALHGCVNATTQQASWLQGLLAQQQLILLGLIDELKGYHNVPTEVPYHLSMANTEGEVTCFLRGDLAEKLAEMKK